METVAEFQERTVINRYLYPPATGETGNLCERIFVKSMNTGITSIYNSFLYYSCLLLIARYILNCIPRKIALILSFLAFIPLAFLVIPNANYLRFLAHITFQLLQFGLLLISFKEIKIRQLIFSYILLYCFNSIIISVLIPFVPASYNYIDIAVNTVTAVLCSALCLTGNRYKIQEMLAWTPKYLKVISCLLLMIAALMAGLISFFQQGDFPEVWNSWIQTLTSFLLVVICLVVPVIFVISNSNTRLKTLTMDYEQQIHAQAEHYKNLAEANYEVRKFRHDFKNIQIAIETLFTQGKYDEAMALLRQCGHSLENPPGLHPKFDTGNGIADALLTDKQEKAVGHNTHIAFRGVIPPETLSPTDLCVLLGNSLDNALDACKKMPIEESKTVSIACDCSSGFLFLTVTNPIAERVQINNNHIVTTKENKTLHGFGLYSLHSIVKKYDGDIQLSATEDSFTIHIDLCLMPAAKPAAAI